MITQAEIQRTSDEQGETSASGATSSAPGTAVKPRSGEQIAPEGVRKASSEPGYVYDGSREVEENRREELRELFKEFCESAGIGDIDFMREMLITRQSAHLRGGPYSVPLAASAAAELGRDYGEFTLMKVPQPLQRKVEAFIERLHGSGSRDADLQAAADLVIARMSNESTYPDEGFLGDLLSSYAAVGFISEENIENALEMFNWHRIMQKEIAESWTRRHERITGLKSKRFKYLADKRNRAALSPDEENELNELREELGNAGN